MRKIWRKIASVTLTYKFVNMFYSGYQYAYDLCIISDILYGDDFKHIIKRYLQCDIYKDWIGRLYGVINPNIDIDGKFTVNNTILELDGEFTNSNEYVKHWIYKQLNLIAEVFKMHKLYDYISMEFRHVGPVNADNYLIVFDMISRQLFARSIKSFVKHLSVYGIIGLIIYLLNIYIY